MRQILFSRTMVNGPDEVVELVGGNMAEFVQDLKAKSDRPIWLCGGAEVASTLMNEELIDRVVVKLNPVVFGNGIPLFTRVAKHVALQLRDTKVYSCGIVLLSYRVGKSKHEA